MEITGRTTDDLVDEAVALLAAEPSFAGIDAAGLRTVAASFDVHEAPAGTTLIEQGAPPTGFFLLLRGRVEIIQGEGDERLLLNVLGPGASFGAMSFVDGLGSAEAAVVTAEPVAYLEIPDDRFRAVLDSHPDLANRLRHDAQTTLKANFLAHTTAFADVDAEARRRLADTIQLVRVEPGQIVVAQGENGETCYLLASGSAEVLVTDSEGQTRRVATVGPGALIGEGALLTTGPRNATVRMTEPGTLLALRREALLSVVGESTALTTDLVGLLRMRWRPRQRPDVVVHRRKTTEGEPIAILEDRKRQAYYRLADDGLFIWERLDGQNTLRQIAMEYVGAYGRFDPERIARAVKGLVDAGFALAPGLRPEVEAQEQPKGIAASSLRVLQALSWTKAVDDVDELFARLDRWIGRWILNPIGVGLLVAVAVVGIVTAITEGPRSTDFLNEAGPLPLVLLGFLPANAVGAVLHEAAHGLTVKRFGRKVKRAGVGWYFITPVAFVDTSDMWLESRWRRALVSVAGPFMNIVLGGASAIAAAAIDQPVASALFWQAAIVSFYLAVINLNPLLEFDGYYILSDALDRPNLRDDALRWLGTEFPQAWRRPSKLRGHGVDLVYGFFALLYMALIVAFIVVVYRALIEGFAADALPDVIASGLAWVIAGGAAALLLLALSAQMRGLSAPRH